MKKTVICLLLVLALLPACALGTPRLAPGSPQVVINGFYHLEGDVMTIDGETFTLEWRAPGKVEAYVVYLDYPSGQREAQHWTTEVARTLTTDVLAPGIYTLRVGAIPKNGAEADAVWGEVSFSIPAPKPTPASTRLTPTPAPTPKAAYRHKAADAAVVYYTRHGKFYHAVPDCSGMKEADPHMLAQAVAEDKRPCRTCQAPDPALLYEARVVWADAASVFHITDDCGAFVGGYRLLPVGEAIRSMTACAVCGADTYAQVSAP